MKDRVVKTYSIELVRFRYDSIEEACENLEEKIAGMVVDNHEQDGFYWEPYGDLIIHTFGGAYADFGSGVLCQPMISYDIEDKEAQEEDV